MLVISGNKFFEPSNCEADVNELNIDAAPMDPDFRQDDGYFGNGIAAGARFG